MISLTDLREGADLEHSGEDRHDDHLDCRPRVQDLGQHLPGALRANGERSDVQDDCRGEVAERDDEREHGHHRLQPAHAHVVGVVSDRNEGASDGPEGKGALVVVAEQPARQAPEGELEGLDKRAPDQEPGRDGQQQHRQRASQHRAAREDHHATRAHGRGDRPRSGEGGNDGGGALVAGRVQGEEARPAPTAASTATAGANGA